MSLALQRPALPPGTEAPGLSFALALLAHALLVWALAYGVNWRSEPELGVAEAELWARVPQVAAPPAPAAEPQPPVKAETPPPPPPPKNETRAAEQAAEREAEIAAEKQRKQRERERERERLEEQQKEREQKKQREERERQQAKEREAKDRDAKAARAEEARREAQRQENLRRIQGMAGNGAPGSSGTAARSAGPSSGYAGRIMARIRPNITFTEPVTTRLVAEVEMRCNPDGTIVSWRLTRSSGNPRYDEAVLRAIEKTERIPRDTDGSVPALIPVIFNSSD